MRFVVAAADRVEPLVRDARLHSSVFLQLPLVDVDDDATSQVGVAFYFSDSPLVLITDTERIPEPLVTAITESVASDLASADRVEDLYDAAFDLRWLPVQLLRRRIRAIEASVRSALDDEEVTQDDYTALREYASRLSKVERLSVAIETPDARNHKPRGDPYSFVTEMTPIDMVPKNMADVGDEAREAVARLSGLISSQQIVLTQRQAADAEAFQRLLTLVGTAVLVPGLVAAVFGANVNFPGRDTSAGFPAMLLLMLASGLGSYVALEALGASGSSFRPTDSEPRLPLRSRVLGVIAAVALLAGVATLWCAA